MFMEDMAVMGFGFPLMVLLLAFLPMLFTGAGAKVAPGFVILLFAALLFSLGFCAAVEAPRAAPAAPAEEQMFEAPPR